MKQQLQVSKRPQTPATPSQPRYPPREVPPRFMQQQKQQQVKGKKAEVDYPGWGESGTAEWDQVVVDDRDKDAWPSVGEERSDTTWGVSGGEGMGSEYISASSSSPSPVSGSVITGSSGGPNSWPSLGDSRSCSLVTSDTMSGVGGNSCGAQSPNHNDWGIGASNCSSGNGSNSGGMVGMDISNGNGGGDASTRRTDSYRATQHGHVQSSPMSEGSGRQQIPGDVLMEGGNSSSSSSMWGNGSSSNSESANGGGPNGSGVWRGANSQQPQQGQQQYARTASGISQNGRNIPNNNVPTGSGLHMNDNYGGTGGAVMGMHGAANPNLVVNAQYSSSNGSSLGDMQSDNSNVGGSGGGSNGARNDNRGGISGWNPNPPGRMGLLGGGEGSVNTGTSSWGNGGNNSVHSQWGNVSGGGNGGSSRNGGTNGPSSNQVTPSKPINTWAQAAGKGLNTNAVSNSSSQGSCVIGQRESQPTELDIRQAISSQEEWGQGSVNQDTAWDLPGTGESPKDKTATWKANQNNGTEIWENTVRNGGKSNNPPAATNSQPWGANPTSNIGGTWGEEEDTSNVWTGVPQSGGARGSSSSDSWGGNSGGGGGGGSSNGGNSNDKMWNGPTKESNQWGGSNSGSGNGNVNGPVHGANSGSGWGEPNSVAVEADDGTSAWTPPVNKAPRSSISQKEVKPCGWEEPSPPQSRRGMPNVDDGTAVWGSPNSRNQQVSRWKEAPSLHNKGGPGPNLSSQTSTQGQGQPGQGSGVIRIPPGTPTGAKPENNVWGKPVTQQRWNDSNHDISNAWDESSGMRTASTSSSGGNNGGGGSGSWGEPTSPLVNNWDKPKANNWNDMNVNTANWCQPSKPGAKPLSKDLIYASRQFRLLHEYGYKKDDVENALRNASMCYEDALTDLQATFGNPLQVGDNDVFGGHIGSHRDDEHSSVLDVSFPSSNVGSFGNNMYPNNGVIGGGPNPTNSSFKSQVAGMSNGNFVHGGSGHNNQSQNLVPGFANLNPNIMHKLMQQQQQQLQQQQQQPQHHQPQHLAYQPSVGSRVNSQSVPSTNQLRLIVQQIQMAVQAGHLNPQILNQPLSPQTLLLLNQLLTQIKSLQQLQVSSQPMGKSNSTAALHMSVQITKTKQQITNLQNQIVAQQAAYMKQQMLQQQLQQQAIAAATIPNTDFIKPTLDPLNLLHSGMQDLSVKDTTPGTPTSTSRLPQWKVPSMEKELDQSTANIGVVSGGSAGEFSRAPGTVTKMPSGSSNFPSAGLNNLFSADTTWSLNRSHSDSGWPDGSSAGESTLNGTGGGGGDQWSASNPNNYNLGDLVTEFEPGKPWKGSQLKNIEDDPHITPGSVARSPLNAINDSELLKSFKTNQAASTDNSFTTPSLSSATWSFSSANTPAAATSSTGGLNYSGGSFSKKWVMGSDSHASISSELWSTPSSKPRGPPPGLGAQKVPVTSTWGSSGNGSTGNGLGGSGVGNRHVWNATTGWERPSASTWLMLRNLTPQIDGSTLRTLCLQHGPLSAFHLYLSQGIALVRYSSREEATKAQSTLNNCVLGNTTIFAEFANETDIQQFLQQSGNTTNVAWSQQGSSGSGGSSVGNNSGVRSNSAVAPTASSSSFSQYGNKIEAGGGPSHWNGTGLNLHSGQLWSLQPSPNAGALWGNNTLTDAMDPRGTPSSLNSYLPGDLLGGENV